MSDNFVRMIQELAGILKIDHFVMDSQTQCTLNIDDFIVLIQHLTESDQVLVACPLGPVPGPDRQDARNALYRQLLQGQFLFKETAGATLAVDPENSFIILQLVHDMAELGKNSLFTVLETFINVATLWRTRLETEMELHEEVQLDMTEVPASYIKV